MGNCSSCLGARRSSVYEEDDESRLLFEDADGAHYGSFGEPVMNDQDDAQESQREFEALQSVVTRTSDNMVDVFEIAPRRPNPHLPAPYSLGIPDNRFQNLLSKLSETDDDDDDADARLEEFGEVDVEAAPPQEYYHGVLSAKADGTGLLVGNFADATAEDGP